MALSDNDLLVGAGLASVALGFAIFIYLLFENQIKSAPWGRIGSALLAYKSVLQILGFAAVFGISFLIGRGQGGLTEPPPPVVKGLPIERITGFYKERTNHEAETLTKPFIGAQVTASGVVEDVYGFGEGAGGMVRFEGPFSSPDVSLRFKAAEFAAATKLTKGDSATAKCEFRGDVSAIDVVIEACRLAEPAALAPS